MHQTSPMGPFDAWPTGGGGFEYFYGFIGGETNQYYPADVRGHDTGRAAQDARAGYHFTEDMTDKAIAWVRQQKALMPRQAVLHVLRAGRDARAAPCARQTWIDRYRGRFDAGWDALREEIFARQKALGVIPGDAELTARPEEIPAWDDMPDELKPVLARQMEVYAAFLAHTDHHVGRLVDALDDLGVLDDTLVYYIIGDNGASAEGTVNGTFNEMFDLQRRRVPRDRRSSWRRRSTTSAGPRRTTTTRSAGRTRWTRPTSGPSRSRRTGAAPATARSCTGRTASQPRGSCAPSSTTSSTSRRPCSKPRACPQPTFVHGVQQMPHHGTSMTYSFDDADGHRAPRPPVLRDVREPGHLPPGMDRSHPTQHTVGHGPTARDRRRRLGALRPRRLDPGARTSRPTTPPSSPSSSGCSSSRPRKYNVLPLDDRRVERFNADLAGRPQLIKGKTQLLFGGMGRLTENSVLITKNKSHAITASVTRARCAAPKA